MLISHFFTFCLAIQTDVAAVESSTDWILLRNTKEREEKWNSQVEVLLALLF